MCRGATPACVSTTTDYSGLPMTYTSACTTCDAYVAFAQYGFNKRSNIKPKAPLVRVLGIPPFTMAQGVLWVRSSTSGLLIRTQHCAAVLPQR